jgi:hypothetical protein
MSDAKTREEINEAIGAHGAWKLRLRTAAQRNERDLPVQDICRDDKCRFGKWLMTVSPNPRNQSHLEKVRRLHAEFHQAAGDIARQIASGDGAAALGALDGPGFDGKSRELKAALTHWKLHG